MLANATVATADAVQVLLTQGPDAFFSQVSSAQAVEGEVFALLDQLKTDEPATVSDASALMLAYANAFDALSSSQFASNQIAALQHGRRQRRPSPSTTPSRSCSSRSSTTSCPAAWWTWPRTSTTSGRGLGGPACPSTVDLAKRGRLLPQGLRRQLRRLPVATW